MAYVKVEFPSGIATTYRSAFNTAAAYWSNVITSGYGSYTFTSAYSLSGCGVSQTIGRGTTVTGLTIFATIEAIDGVGSILGSAGPCVLTGNYPLYGLMRFDSADSASLVSSGQFGDVIRHEMAHVIGIGSLWSRNGLVSSPCIIAPCFTNPTYSGAQGIAGYRELGGSGSLLVGNENGPGTFNVHWRENFFGNELMTGFLNSGSSNPVSIMTIRSLRDMGYSVNTNYQESYSIPSAQRLEELEEGALIALEGDVLWFDHVDIDEVMMGAQLEEESANLKAEFASILTLMIVGFALLSGLIVHQGKKQKDFFGKLPVKSQFYEVKMKNPMHQEM